MEELPNTEKQLEDNDHGNGGVPQKNFKIVKSRYLNKITKGSSQSDNWAIKSALGAAVKQNSSSEVIKSKAYYLAANSTQIGSKDQVLKPGQVLPTKDVSLFAADVSLIPIGTECKVQKKLKQEDLGKIEEEILLQDNVALCVQTLHFLTKKHLATSAQVCDKQLATLQKAVKDSESILSTMDVTVYAAALLAELQEDLTMCEDAIAEVSDDPAFSDPKCFEDLSSEIEINLNQQTCKNVKIPSSAEDLDQIQRAATKLSRELSTNLQDHGKEIGRVSCVRRDMAQINALCDTLSKSNASMEELMPKASSKVLDKICKDLMKSTFATMDIEF